LTEAPRIKPTSPRCRSAWQPNPAEAPLIDAEILFRQSGPALKGAPKDLSLAYAYFKLSKLAPKTKVNEMAAILSKPELQKAEKLVSEWKPQPTALTLKAMSGVKAAEEHLKATKN
jgi:hypothetical protein